MVRWRRCVAAAVMVVGLTTLTACGDEGRPDEQAPDSPPPSDSAGPGDETELTGSQLRKALIGLGDIPPELGTSFERIHGAPSVGSDDMLSGPQECADYLDGDYGPDELDEYELEYRDEQAVAAVYSTIRSYDDGEAADQFAALRELFGVCREFTLAGGDVPTEVAAAFSELDIFPELADLADEGVYVQFVLSEAGTPVHVLRYVLLRVDDLVSFVGIQVNPGSLDAPLFELVTTAADKLDDVAEQAR